MRTTRIYHTGELSVNKNIVLSEEASRHVGLVLRLKVGNKIILFNNTGFDYISEISEINKKNIKINILEKISVNLESKIKIHLFQGISRNERMDFVMQKAVELGVTEITPVISEFCTVKFNPQKLDHWNKIIISACEQSGRSILPILNSPKNFHELDLNNIIMFDPKGRGSLFPTSTGLIQFIVGPEGGFSEKEIAATKHVVKLGNRILRTETAAIAAMSAIQTLYGDFVD